MMDTATRSIQIQTAIPGPRSQAIGARREAAIPQGVYKAHPIAVERADGALVTDVDGNTFIDFVGGIGVLNIGHCAPEVVAAIQEQAAKLIHMCSLVATYEPMVDLAERMNQLVPISGPIKTMFANSGAEAVENAIKIARVATGRSAIIAYDGAYHGRTLLTTTLTSKTSFKKGDGPFAPEIYRAPYPYEFQCNLCDAECSGNCFGRLEAMLLTHVEAEKVAAIIIEPVQGEGGFIPVRPAYMQQLRALCDRIGALLIADEVQCGFGRTGTLFAMEQMGCEPDILVSAKSIAAGMPLAAVTGRASVMDKVPVGGLGGTYSGNPLACVAAIEVIKSLTGENGRDPLMARANVIGAAIRQHGARWTDDLPFIGEVRGLGAMMAIEFVKDRQTREPDPDRAARVITKCLQNGLITMRAGLYTNCIRLLMPFTITDEQLQEGLDVLDTALRSEIM
ncbi:MAG: aspartate aminotransferase family protein [Roseiflexaceae bacterium]|nr:aspartate aminotransferase family protein [Roseiflexaceae bacterium]